MMRTQVKSPSVRWALSSVAITLLLSLCPIGQAQIGTSPLTVTTIAGVAGAAQSTNGTGTAARFYGPTGIILDSSGNLIIADSVNNLIRKMTAAGVVSTLAGTPMDNDTHPINVGIADGTGAAASFHMGEPILGDSDPTLGSATLGIDSAGNVYFADTQSNTIRRISATGTVVTIAGTANSYGSADGTGSAATFLSPAGVAVDASGNIYVADAGNHTIRKITPGFAVSTFAGVARGYGSDDGIGNAARFYAPGGVAIDSAGNLYVTDSGNHTIRKITAAGVVTTLAGTVGKSGLADGAGSQARFSNPNGLTVDASGNVYVADTGNNVIRKITPGGTVFTVAGIPGPSGSADGTGTAVRFNQPYSITVDASGNLYIADSLNHTLRRGVISASSPSISITGAPAAKVQANTDATVTLKIVATGSGSLSYQWSKDGAALAGATGSTLVLNGVTSTNAGMYSVTISSGTMTYTSGFTEFQVFPTSIAVPSVAIVDQPADRVVTAGQSTTFTVEASSSLGLTYKWFKDGSLLGGATTAAYTIGSVQPSNAGSYTVTITDGNSTVTTPAAVLTVISSSQSTAPAFTSQPTAQTVTVGGAATFTVAASGNPAPSYQWLKDGAAITNRANVSGATTSILTITSASASDAGNYSVTASNSAGSATSTAAALTVNSGSSGPTAWLTNLSVLTTIRAGQDPLTVGISVNGGKKSILVRAAGPELGKLLSKTSGFMVDPSLELYNGTTKIAEVQDWDSSLTTTFTALGAFPWPDYGSKDAAQIWQLDGGYSVRLPANGPGQVIIEAYDTAPSNNSPRLTNISARNWVSADSLLTEGFYISGSGTKKLLIRGVGPGLAQWLSDYLVDPKLEIYDSNQKKIYENDTWDSNLATTFKSVAAFDLPAGSKDAAIVVTLPAGATYTAQIKGADGGSGQAIVELYELP